MQYRLIDVCSVIRSKNSGPYELTFDMIFKERDVYQRVISANVFNEECICAIFGISRSKIINIINFEPANAIKITICRERVSGDIGESDIYGAQQHGTLMDLIFEI